VTFPYAHDATVARQNHCKRIAVRLNRMGYVCDWRRVNRNYIMFRRWDNGLLALGYLVRNTGLQKKSTER
jgi:hypothetical protein